MAQKQETKNKTKIAEIAKEPVSVYHRFLRYPSFPITPRKEIIHSTNEGGKIIIVTNNATIEDEEKLFALVHLIQTGKAKVIDAKIVADKADEDDEEDNNLAIVETSLYQLFKITNVHDYKRIVDSLLKMSNVLMISDFIENNGKHKKRYVKPIFKLVVGENNKIKVYMYKRFLELCIKKALTFDLAIWLKLPPVAKNLYLFLYANLDKNTFSIDTIVERTLLRIDTSEKKYTIKNVRRAFDALKKEKIIRDYQIDTEKKKIKIQYSKKALEKDKKIDSENP